MGLSRYPNGVISFGNVVHAGFGIGNVYNVCQPSNSVVYSDVVQRYGAERYSNDGSNMFHTEIQKALDATVASRNDYVVVWGDGSDYDLTEPLTMTKKGVHLICPAGLSMDGGMGANACRIEQTTAGEPIITSTADCIEVAGFFFKGMADSPIITLSGTRWHNYIHNNFLGGKTTAGAAIYQIYGDGHVWHSAIVDNFIMAGYAPAANKTISGCIGFTSGSSGRNLIKGNTICTGGQTVVTAGVKLAGTNDMMVRNIFHETIATLLAAGTFTKAWDTSASTIFIKNEVAMDTPAMSGGTVNNSHVENWSATAGNTIIEAS